MTVGLGGAGLPAKSEGTSNAQSSGKAVATVATALAKGIASAAEEATQQTQTQPTDKSNVDKKLKNDSVKPIDIFGDKPHPILCNMLPDPFIRKLDNHIDPAKLVENVRQSDGTEGKIAMHEFDGAVDKMGTKNLREVRDYLVKEMASPKNKDDQLLGSMLDSVNKKLDSKDSFSIHKDPFELIDPGFNDKGIEGNHSKHFPIDPGFNKFPIDKGSEKNKILYELKKHHANPELFKELKNDWVKDENITKLEAKIKN